MLLHRFLLLSVVDIVSASEMTYIVSGGELNSILTHSVDIVTLSWQRRATFWARAWTKNAGAY